MIILFLTIAQSWVENSKEEYSAQIQAKEDSIQRLKQYIDDSVRTSQTISEINKGVDSATSLIYRNLSEALAKQKLKFDSTNKLILDLRDSVRNGNLEEPLLIVHQSGISIKKESQRSVIQIQIESLNSSADVSYMAFAGIFTTKTGKKIGRSIDTIVKQVTLPRDQPLGVNIPINTDQELEKAEILAVGLYRKSNSKYNLKEFKNVYVYLAGSTTFLNNPRKSQWLETNKDLFSR